MAGELSALVSRLEAVTTKLEGIAANSGGAGGSQEGSQDGAEFLTAYDEQITNGANTVKFLTLGAAIGGDLAKQIAIYKQALDQHRQFLVLVSKYKKPSQDVLAKLIQPLSAKMAEVVEFFEKNRVSKLIINLQAVKEGIQSLGWIASPKPAPFVKQAMESAQFYTNKLLVAFKGKDQNQLDWARGYLASIADLQAYVKEFHTIGPSWNSKGANPSGASMTAPPPSAGAPPPPPPPTVLPPTGAPAAAKQQDAEVDRSALFSAINKGGAVTGGLRKVADDQKTHKNPNLRAGSKVEATEKKPAASPKFGSGAAQKKPPVCELQGKKWVVEYQVDNKDIVINAPNHHQSVYMFRCERCTVRVNGKVNFIALDNCKKIALAFDGVVASLEVLNCQSIQAQVMHQLPTLSIDKTDGCQVYLSKESLNCELITAKSSEMNILIPSSSGGDFSEHAVAEQFRTRWDGKKLVTTTTDING